MYVYKLLYVSVQTTLCTCISYARVQTMYVYKLLYVSFQIINV